MPINPQVPISIREEVEVGQARRRAQQIANNAGLNETEAGKSAVIASESATNVIKHGGGGEVILREIEHGIEVLALDKGRGMEDVSRCLSDGYSSSGTAGTGLGAIKRMSSVFDVYSRLQQGTAMVARLGHEDHHHQHPRFDYGVVCRPKHGEALCGDGWVEIEHDGSAWIMVADGLGHGPDAHEASSEAVKAFRKMHPKSTSGCMEMLHGVLRKTRGAAVSVAQIDPQARQVRFSGVGNVSAAIIDAASATRSLISHNGILGHEVRRIQEFSYPWPHGAKLIMSSDGLATWHLEKYPGLIQRHPSIIAGVLYRDYWRQRDDVTVLVAQEASGK